MSIKSELKAIAKIADILEKLDVREQFSVVKYIEGKFGYDDLPVTHVFSRTTGISTPVENDQVTCM